MGNADDDCCRPTSPAPVEVATPLTWGHGMISFHSTTTVPCGTGWKVRGADGEGPGLLLLASAHVDRYAHGMTAAKGMAGRYLDLQIIARLERLGGS